MRVHLNAVGAVMGGAATHLPAFVGALLSVRPEWELVIYVSAEAPALSGATAHTHVVKARSWKRIAWDTTRVGALARRDGAGALINLTNYGPLRSPVPSLLYQRNAVYFDPTWVRRMTPRDRVEAAARRQLAFQQMRGSAVTIVPSNAMAAYLRSWNGYPTHARVEVVPHGVDIGRFQFRPHAWQKPLQLVSVSHAAPYKGQDLLIDLVQELRGRGVDVRLRATIADEDDKPYVAHLRAKISAACLADNITLVGRVETASFLATADMMVLPSLTESFGFPLIEAMAAGIPVIASSIPSTRELLGSFGWFFPVGDASAAADMVIEALHAPAVLLEEILVGARRAAANYTWRRNAKQIAALVEETRR